MTGTTRHHVHRLTTVAEATALSAFTAAVDAVVLVAWSRACRRAREGRTR